MNEIDKYKLLKILEWEGYNFRKDIFTVEDAEYDNRQSFETLENGKDIFLLKDEEIRWDILYKIAKMEGYIYNDKTNLWYKS